MAKRLAGKITRTMKDVFFLYKDNDMDVYAGYSTLYVITGLFPFIMLVIALINMLPGYSPSGITDRLFDFLPDLPSLRELVVTIISNLKDQSTGILTSISALVTLLSASRGVASLQKGLEKLSSKGKNGIREIIISLLFTLALVILIPALIVFNLLGQPITELLRSVAVNIGLENMVDRVSSLIHTSSIISFAVVVLLTLLAYVYLPGGKPSWKTKFPGTIFTVIIGMLFTRLFSFFIPRFYHSSSIYGSLASLFLMLMWMRITIMIFFFGAAVNSVISKDNSCQDAVADGHQNMSTKEAIADE